MAGTYIAHTPYHDIHVAVLHVACDKLPTTLTESYDKTT